MTAHFYESDAALSQYLLFHYGTADEILPYPGGPREALQFPVRCVRECIRPEAIHPGGRALDLGCAVGRSSFELARLCQEVIGVDRSSAFVEAARHVQKEGRIDFRYPVEGEIHATCHAELPADIPTERVSFQIGDAMTLEKSLGTFDVVLMANLIDRLPSPVDCLKKLPALVRPGGQLIITSPYTWMEGYTPRGRWLATPDGKSSFATLGENLAGNFNLVERRDLPFLIREHARKFQWSVSDSTVWRRRE